MKRLLLPLLAALALPNAVNAEIIEVPKSELIDSWTHRVFWGQMINICYADNKGYLKNNEKDFVNLGIKTKGLNKSLKNQPKYNLSIVSFIGA